MTRLCFSAPLIAASCTVLLGFAGPRAVAQVHNDTVITPGSGTSNAETAKNAALAAARADMARAKSALQAATDKVRTTWKANPQMIEADDNLTNARKDYDAAKRAVVERLKKDPEYEAALKEQGKTVSKLHDAQQSTASTQPSAVTPGDSVQSAAALPAASNATVEAATEKLENKTKIRNMEDTAIGNDPNASKAQAKLNDAEKQSKVWHLQLEAALKNDSDYRAALDQVQAARQRLGAAGAAQQN